MHDTVDKISIIIPVGLDKSLHPDFEETIKHSSLKNHEIVIIRDESSKSNLNDQTRLTLDRISNSQLENVIIVSEETSGPGGCRNIGIKYSHNDWIYFWDADDKPIVESALKMAEFTASQGAQVGIGRANRINQNTASTPVEVSNSLWGILSWPGIWRVVFHRTIIEDVRFPDWKWCEDQDFILHAISRASKISRFHEIVYTYYQGVPKSTTTEVQNWMFLKVFVKELLGTHHSSSNVLLRELFLLKTLLALTKRQPLPWILQIFRRVPFGALLLLRQFRSLKQIGLL